MGGYNKFNVVFNINGVEFVDCRAYLKVANWTYKRVGADDFNNCDILSADAVEAICLVQGIEYQDLITEDEMNNDFMSMFQNGTN